MIKLDEFRSGFINKHPYNDINGEHADFINRYSQNGEEGVLEKIFDILGISNGVFVNAGCDDINDHSNIRRLISLFGWHGLFIEPNTPWLNQGIENIQKDNRIIDKSIFQYHNGFLSVNKEDEKISNVINQYYVDGKLFDLLTLKIDSYEYWVLQDFLLSNYDAKVILVGYNSSLTRSITAPKNCAPKLGHNSIRDNFYGASLPAINKLMNKHEYELVSICRPNNLIYINKRFNNGKFQVHRNVMLEDYYFEVRQGHGIREHITEGWVEV
tara:strand:- start:1493 stop:2302 length:810 start_codon:yes stop_codon:yes gene_type:complete